MNTIPHEPVRVTPSLLEKYRNQEPDIPQARRTVRQECVDALKFLADEHRLQFFLCPSFDGSGKHVLELQHNV